MENIIVKKNDLLEALRKNRDGHKHVFKLAEQGWLIQAQEELKGMLHRASNGQVFRVAFALPVPEDHTKDYDRVIAMVEMETRKEINLSETDFSSYVMDDWDWMKQWTGSNTGYVRRASSSH